MKKGVVYSLNDLLSYASCPSVSLSRWYCLNRSGISEYYIEKLVSVRIIFNDEVMSEDHLVLSFKYRDIG